MCSRTELRNICGRKILALFLQYDIIRCPFSRVGHIPMVNNILWRLNLGEFKMKLDMQDTLCFLYILIVPIPHALV